MQTRSPNNIKAIDVSHHQGTIDWPKVAASGVKGAYVKASEGVGYKDPQYRRNAVGVPAVGIKVGFYHYARPETGNTAKQEAESFLAAVAGLQADLPYVLDVEGDAAKLGAAKLTDWSLEWLQIVSKQSGKPVMVYTGASFAKNYLSAKLASYPLWVAHYGDPLRPMSGPTWDNWAVWQYTSDGTVPGIAGRVDMNEFDVLYWEELFTVKQTFKDVPTEHWASGAIEAAAAAGVLGGYSDGTFKPSQALTRAELAAFWAKMTNAKK